MAMQDQGTAPSRNQQTGAAMPGKISAPERSGSPGDVPSTGNGHMPGSAVKGFSGAGVLPGKISI